MYSINVPSLINAPTPFCGKKADQNAIKMALISQTFPIFVQNLSERMSFLELLNCNAAEGFYRLIMNYYVNLLKGLEDWSRISGHKQKYKCV